MGCDIHTMAEVQKDVFDREKEEWVSAPDEAAWKALKREVFPYAYHHEEEPASRFNPAFSSTPYVGRNYVLFSVLADVRNERKTSNIFDSTMEYEERDSIDPIAMPRGVPENASKAWKREVKRWGRDFHSHSYFTLQELLDAKEAGAFSQKIVQRGYVGLGAYLHFKQTGETPRAWASYTSGPAMKEAEWEALTDEEKAPYLEKVSADPFRYSFDEVSIRTQWVWDMSKSMEEFFQTMEHLKLNAPRNPRKLPEDMPLAERRALPLEEKFDYDYSRIRIVFAFDN